eukprot:745264-Rhodomonas_salina.1
MQSRGLFGPSTSNASGVIMHHRAPTSSRHAEVVDQARRGTAYLGLVQKSLQAIDLRIAPHRSMASPSQIHRTSITDASHMYDASNPPQIQQIHHKHIANPSVPRTSHRTDTSFPQADVPSFHIALRSS